MTKLNTPLTINEIDFRVQSINKGFYATILAYKDARVDMNRLDEVYGVEGWQKKYDIVNGNLFCSVGIWSKELNQWIWKQDVGTESNTEKEKGQASDAFKRACFNLGIGRELYDYPIISIKLNDSEAELKGDKVVPKFGFKLRDWKWTSEFKGGKLVYLEGKDTNGTIRFKYSSELPNEVEGATDEQINLIDSLLKNSSLAEEVKEKVERECSKYSFKKANDCIAKLKESQIDPITHRGTGSQTEIKEHLKKM